MQNYVDILGTDLVKNSRERINNNIKTVASNYSGDEFPTDNLEEGMTCYRTDRKEMYIYTIDENDYGRWLLLFRFNEDGDVVVVNATIAEQLEHPPIIPDPVPTGCVQTFAGIAIPNGWLLCDGSAVSRTIYVALFTVIGTTYGAGDGTSTFNLPNLTGRVAVGAGSSYPLAVTGGEASHTLTVDEMAVHDHTFAGDTVNTGIQSANHTHNRGNMEITGGIKGGAVEEAGSSAYGAFSIIKTDYQGAGRGQEDYGFDFKASRSWSGNTGKNSVNHTHSVTAAGTISNSGGGSAHNNMQPYIALKYIIKC